MSEEQLKTKKKSHTALIIIIAVVVLGAAAGAVCFFGFREGGFFNKEDSAGGTATEQKDSGNAETSGANAQERKLSEIKTIEQRWFTFSKFNRRLPSDGSATYGETMPEDFTPVQSTQMKSTELIQNAHKNIPVIRANDQMNELEQLSSHLKRGGDKK